MTQNQSVEPMSWGMIVLIVVVVGLGAGVILGGLRSLLGLSGGIATTGVGAAIGVSGALLIMRRKAALETQAKKKPSDV